MITRDQVAEKHRGLPRNSTDQARLYLSIVSLAIQQASFVDDSELACAGHQRGLAPGYLRRQSSLMLRMSYG